MFKRLLWSLFIIFAHLATAIVHLWWKDLAWSATRMVRLSLASPSIGILEGIARLHLLVLLAFAVILSFRATSAQQLPLTSERSEIILDFDDIHTTAGWADIPSNYTCLEFTDFYVLRPSDPALKGLISKHDLNCAASCPNALYGARSLPLHRIPRMQLHSADDAIGPSSFTLHSLKLKALDMPLAYAKVNLKGHQITNATLLWDVDFPAGFHDMLNVDIAAFSGKLWDQLKTLEIWADFHHSGTTMDWEFCLDDLVVSFQT